MGVASGERGANGPCGAQARRFARRIAKRALMLFWRSEMARAKDKYGFAIGSRASQVAWFYSRPNGATNLDIMERFGGTRTTFLEKVQQRGFH